MVMKMFRGLKNSSGQSLPLVILFMGLIIGAAALTIDYGKVSALRNESQAATSAAALAATKSLEGSLQTGSATGSFTVKSNGSITFSSLPATITLNLSNVYSQANTVYQDNIRHAISHTSSLGTLVLTYSETPTGPTQSFNQSSSSATLTLPLYIHASASGSTSMNFASALGFAQAKVVPKSTAVFDADTSAVNNGNFIPLGMPNTYPYQPGTTYYAYRGDNGNMSSSSSPIPIMFLGIYGSGSDGWLALGGPMLTVGSSAGTPGSSEWNNLFGEGVVASRIVMFPLVDAQTSTIHGNNGQVQLDGFITAKIDVVDPNSNGSHSGFTFTVLSDTAENDALAACPPKDSSSDDTPDPCAIQSGTPYWLFYSLAPNSTATG